MRPNNPQVATRRVRRAERLWAAKTPTPPLWGQGVAGSNPAVPTQVRRLPHVQGRLSGVSGTKIGGCGASGRALTAGQVCRHAVEVGSSAAPWLSDVELGLHSVQGRDWPVQDKSPCGQQISTSAPLGAVPGRRR
jgi:hypothetical protein